MRAVLIGVLAVTTVLAGQPAAAKEPVGKESGGMDTRAIAAKHYGNDAAWYVDRIPFFESSDTQIDDVYYYRWAIYRAHQRDLGKAGFITTEFLDDVSWQREPYASLNDASGFHITEGRWLRDPRFVDDYINYMYRGGNDRHFSDYMADATWQRYLADGDRVAVTRHLAAMQRLYDLWNDHYDASKGLYWIEPLLDATEYTVSSIDASGGKDGFTGGQAFRPSINAYMFANARAIANIAQLAGQPDSVVQGYRAKAGAIKQHLQDDLWNPGLSHFADRYFVSNAYVKYWDPIRSRELVGYVPWAFDMPDDDARFSGAWSHLLSPQELGGVAGMRTGEPSYEYYMRQYRYFEGRRECQWNGPAWPFQTTQVLTGMANLLDHYHQDVVTKSDYMRLLRQYTLMHYQDGRLDLEEDYDPETGKPIVGLDRSHHYFHSGYVDLVLTGLAGIRPRADNVLDVDPILPAAGDPQALSWFRVADVPYHGHRIAITWDGDGSHYGAKGLSVAVDGKAAAHRDDIGRLSVTLGAATVVKAAVAPIDQAVQLDRKGFPMGSASSGTGVENVHDAIDGRVWFFPELPNGWMSDGGDTPQWYAIDFGHAIDSRRAELAFFADGKAFAAPRDYRIQAWRDGDWQDVAVSKTAAVANGVTPVAWEVTPTTKLRVLMTPEVGKRIRLVEVKVF